MSSEDEGSNVVGETKSSPNGEHLRTTAMPPPKVASHVLQEDNTPRWITSILKDGREITGSNSVLLKGNFPNNNNNNERENHH